MTDSLSDTRSTAAIQIAAGPVWNLAAPEAAFPFQVELNGKTFEVYGVLRQPYSAEAVIEAINRNRGGYRRTAATLENVTGDTLAFGPVADKLFIRLEGTSSDDPAAHKRWLDQNFQLKGKLAREGLGGILIDKSLPSEAPPLEADKLDLLPLALDVANETVIAVRQELWNSPLKAKLTIRMRHVLRPETERDWRAWTRTAAERFTKANNQWTEGVDWWKRIELYDGMVRRVEGMTVGAAGETPCTEANRDEWLPILPAWHKLLVIGEVFDESRVKN